MHSVSYDLHIHSCLSPCGDEDMTPANIVHMAKLKELEVIAVTDHNSCKNCPAVLALAKQNNIIAIPGMELCTLEEVHVLCLFAELENALRFDAFVSTRLLKLPNNEKVFGKQEIYGEDDSKIGDEPYLLINATEISFDDLEDLMLEYQGIYLPSHLDKNTNSLISNLGFVPPTSGFRCAELMNLSRQEELCMKNPYLRHCNIITNSDAHTLGDIKEANQFLQVSNLSREGVLAALIKT